MESGLKDRISVIPVAGSISVFLLLSLIDFHNQLIEMWIVPLFFVVLLTKSALRGRRMETCGSGCRIVHKVSGYVLVLLLCGMWIVGVYGRYMNEEARELGYAYATDGQVEQALKAYERAVMFDWTDAESGMVSAMPGSDSDACCSVSVAGGNAQSGILGAAPSRFHADYAEALFALIHRTCSSGNEIRAGAFPLARYTMKNGSDV